MASTTNRAGHQAHAEAVAYCPTGLLIDGAFVRASDERTLAVEDPATGRVIAEVADASPADCMAALDAAVAAQASWAHAPRASGPGSCAARARPRDQAEQMAPS